MRLQYCTVLYSLSDAVLLHPTFLFIETKSTVRQKSRLQGESTQKSIETEDWRTLFVTGQVQIIGTGSGTIVIM